MAAESGAGSADPGSVEDGAPGQAEELPAVSGTSGLSKPFRTPLFNAQHAERYARQGLIRDYELATGANLIVVVDVIFQDNLTYLEELLFDCDTSRPLHVLLASPGGDGETAIRMVRSMQARCTDLTMVLPDMAKSAATLMCLGADAILMGPGGDLGPVDPQFPMPGPRGGLAGAKEIVAAIDEAEERISLAPETFPLFASLLADVNMIMVEQARSALARSSALVREALACVESRTAESVAELAESLSKPLIDDPTSHSAVIAADAAAEFGLPARSADPASEQWGLIWSLWCRYFMLGAFPRGETAVYEGHRASHIIVPTPR